MTDKWPEDMTRAQRADAILASGKRGNHPCGGGKRLVGWIVDEDLVGLSEGLFAIEEIEKRARVSSGERLWCTKCGTVTRDETCDCNRWGADFEPNFINYADAMQEAAHEQAQRAFALEKALMDIREASAAPNQPHTAVAKCFDIAIQALGACIAPQPESPVGGSPK